jgi:replicative DNA helicase
MLIGAQQPPHNVEAEQQLLGALLTNNDLAHKVTGILKTDDFYDPVHKRVFIAAMARIERGDLASPVTLRADMEHDSGLQEIGGPAYLMRLAGAAISSFAVIDFAKLIAEMARRRDLLALCEQVTARIMSDEPAGAAMADMEMFLHKQEPVGDPRSMSLLKAHTEAIQDVYDVGRGQSPAIPSGLASLDEAVSLRRGRYTILAGSTSMGKTALAQWISYSAAKAGFGVGFVSLEMPERDLAARMNSIDSQIPYKAFERAMSENTMRKVIEAAKAQEAMPFEIFSSRVRDIPAILSEARKLKHKWPVDPRGFKGLALLVVDYIQLIRGKGRSFDVLSEAANELKQIAKLLDVHVIALAQIDRGVMERENTRPGLSDLRGSGDLENAPDNVIFCHREEYFLARRPQPKKADEMADWLADLEASKGKMDLIVAKARMGELGTVKVGCDMATNRFFDLDSTKEMDF